MDDAPRVPRCGDTVRHRPSGENWFVAWADPDRDEIAWAGWPDGRGKLSDCELTRIATDAQHLAAVDCWRRSGRSREGDTRRANVLRRYGTDEERSGG